MLFPLYIAQQEYRDRVRAFNIRANRGEFVRYAYEREQSRARWSERLSKLSSAIRHQFSRPSAQNLVVRPGVDSV